MKRKVLLAIPLTIVLLVAAVGLFFRILSNATEFCPLSHKFKYQQMCKVIDRKGSLLLIEHQDLDLATFQLSIYDRSNRNQKWIDHPIGSVGGLSGGFHEGVIRFDPADSSRLTVDGKAFPITDVSETSAKPYPGRY